MIELSVSIGLIGGAISGVLYGLAKVRMAGAWKIWAERCDPMNPNFRPPFISRLP